MDVLVTGDAGFVGRNFVRHLLAAGHEVVGVDIRELQTSRSYEHHTMDCREFFASSKGETFDLVVHLAAVVGGRVKIEGSPMDVAVDLSIDAEMFNWALRSRPSRVVYYSSSAAYPISLQTQINRVALHPMHINVDDPRMPDQTYGWAKLTGEILAHHARKAGLNVSVFRPFSGYGTDQDDDYPFPSFIKRALRRDNPFDVWGNGRQMRDFIHIHDIIESTMAAVHAQKDGPFNLGSGFGTSFNGLARLITVEAGYSPEIRHLPAKPTGVFYRVAEAGSVTKLRTPTISLREGVQRALAGQL